MRAFSCSNAPKGSPSVTAELLCGRRPRGWSPILILRGVLVIFYGHGKRNGSRARAPYVRTSHFMTFLYEAIFAQLLVNGDEKSRKSFDACCIRESRSDKITRENNG